MGGRAGPGVTPPNPRCRLSNAAARPDSVWRALAALLTVLIAGQPGLTAAGAQAREARPELAVGVAGHAFDHLGNIGEQASTALRSGANILYGTGFGAAGYQGLPSEARRQELRESTAAYLREARRSGLRLAFGYVCATSIVGLDRFDREWSAAFRRQFRTAPAEWLQQDREGRPLPSWYGGDYRPACMNHPDWRRYEKAVVRLQLESGFDGIFFDNPTVHPGGCYCAHCMAGFAKYCRTHGAMAFAGEPHSVEQLRRLAEAQPVDFLRYRAAIAAEFLGEMRRFARAINPRALITCNNSLNRPEVFYSQARTYGYNIHELSRTEDLVVVEDMVNQPRRLASGESVEYGPVYELLRAISRGKPLVAVTLADADYHTPPNLVRLAMAEAAAHNASYLSWPTWPEPVRDRMADAVRPQADPLRRMAPVLSGASTPADALLYVPFHRWAETDACRALAIARALSRANVAFEAVADDDLVHALDARPAPVLVVEALSVLTASQTAAVDRFRRRRGVVVEAQGPDWMTMAHRAVGRPVVQLEGPKGVRAVVRAQRGKQIVHLLNLAVTRLSSFEDRVTPADNIKLTLRCPFRPRSARAMTADAGAASGPLPFESQPDGDGARLTLTIPRLAVSTILVIE